MKRYPPVDPFKAKIVEEAVAATAPPKDGLAPLPDDSQLSIDSMQKDGLRAIYGVMRACLAESRLPQPSREAVQNLKDVLVLLRELKELEEDVAEKLSDEELERLADE